MKTILIIATWSRLLFGQPLQAQEVNICSLSQPFLIEPFFSAFTEETGIETKVLYSKKGLAQRLKNEGQFSPADVVLTVDIARLSAYNSMGLLAQTVSETLENYIPAHLSSAANTWFALSKRSRMITTCRDRVAQGELTGNEDLADPKWKGRVCKKLGSNVYNCVLMALMVAHHMTKAAEEWANGLVANLARKPQGNNRAHVKAILEDVCDEALINIYCYGKVKFSEDSDQKAWAASMNIVYPNHAESDCGAHINVSSGGVATHSKNRESVVKLLEFLSQERSQHPYSKINFEYPAKPRFNPTEELQSWGAFKEDQVPIATIAKLSRQAQMMVDRVGW